MRFCFIIEAQYRYELMPLGVVRQLIEWGHEVDLLEPETTMTCLSGLSRGTFDACVLKTVSDGPGLSLLEAAEAIDIQTTRVFAVEQFLLDYHPLSTVLYAPNPDPDGVSDEGKGRYCLLAHML